MNDYRDILKEEFRTRRNRNARYSQAAFARDLELSASCLSEILSGKQGISTAKALRIAEKLRIRSSQKQHFVDLVQSKHARNRVEREEALGRLAAYAQNQSYDDRQPEMLKFVTDWYLLAILALTQLKDFQSAPEWIGEQLGLPPVTIMEAVGKLSRLGLLQTGQSGWQSLSSTHSVPTNIAPDVSKKLYEQFLKNAARALHNPTNAMQDFATVLLAIDQEKIPEVIGRINDFWKSISRDLGSSTEATDVYCLNIQLFNLTPGKR